MQALAKNINKLLKPHAMRQGFADVRILSQWGNIVGAELADHVRPQAIRNGVLCIEAADSVWAMQVMHMQPQIIERINGYFGYAAIQRIRTEQTYFTPRPRQAAPRYPVLPVHEAQAARQLADIKDATLRERLQKLGALLVAQQQEKPSKEVA